MSEVSTRPLIGTWAELEEIDDSEKYTIDIEGGYAAFIRNKETGDTEWYLSTHTFYESTYMHSTEILNKYGFDVQLKSWG